jgi:hypothetical protein
VDQWASIIHPDNYGTMVPEVCDSNERTERQTPVRTSHLVHIEGFTACGLLALKGWPVPRRSPGLKPPDEMVLGCLMAKTVAGIGDHSCLLRRGGAEKRKSGCQHSPYEDRISNEPPMRNCDSCHIPPTHILRTSSGMVNEIASANLHSNY